MNLALGRLGEYIAVKYIQRLGFLLLHRNYHTKAGEIDIIAEKGGTIYCIEVKTRTNLRYGKPYEAVTYIKQQHMRRAAQWYILQTNRTASKLKLAVISIVYKKPEDDIKMYVLD